MATTTKRGFLDHEKIKYLPPYFQNTTETLTPVECEVQGELPKWVSGVMIRMTFGTYVLPTCEDGSKPPAVLQHYFDGLATTNRFYINNGKVFYNSRKTAKGVAKKTKKNGYCSSMFFGPNPNTALIEAKDPCSVLYASKQTLFVPIEHLAPDEFNVSVAPRRSIPMPPSTNPLDRGTPAKDPAKDEIMIVTDFNAIQVSDQKTLEPKRLLTYANIDPELKGFGAVAHPGKDRIRKQLYNYLITDQNTMFVYALDYRSTPTKLLWKTQLPCMPCYMHAIAHTENYVVFVRNPVVFNMSDPSKTLADMLVCEENTPTMFIIIDKNNGSVIARYDAPGFFHFHCANAYDFKEDGDDSIHVDLVSYVPDPELLHEYNFSNLSDPGRPFTNAYLVRYELAGVWGQQAMGRTGIACVSQAIAGPGMELPRINKTFTMKKGYRYVYGVGFGGTTPGTLVPLGRLGTGVKMIQTSFFSTITKSDWKTGTYVSWSPGDGESQTTEPVFVEAPGGVREDDGVVLTVVCNKTGTHSILIVLDAREMKEIARAILPQLCGVGAHCTFIEK